MVTNLSDDTKINRKDKRGIKYRFKKLCEYQGDLIKTPPLKDRKIFNSLGGVLIISGNRPIVLGGF